MVLIIDYGLSNIASIVNMVQKLGHRAAVSARPEDVRSASRLILPGVGSFDAGMRRLSESGLADALDERRRAGVPLLGVCLGMQLLFEGSAEGQLAGLGFVRGRAKRFAVDAAAKVPHMGWNTLDVQRPHPLLASVPQPSRFYFVHSYHVVCDDDADVVAVAKHGITFCAACAHDNVAGVQFHPEKSHRYGMKLFESFLGWTP
jgi:glutamine amidotransferase